MGAKQKKQHQPKKNRVENGWRAAQEGEGKKGGKKISGEFTPSGKGKLGARNEQKLVGREGGGVGKRKKRNTHKGLGKSTGRVKLWQEKEEPSGKEKPEKKIK